MSNLITDDLRARMYDNLDKIFPGMEWTRRGRKWVSQYTLDGERTTTKDKSFVKEKYLDKLAENSSRGAKKDVVQLYMDLYHKDFMAALVDICQICGAPVPNQNTADEYKRTRMKQDKIMAFADKMHKALYTDDGAAALKYLKEVRGYNDDFIAYGELGVLTDNICRELRDEFNASLKTGDLDPGTQFPNLSAKAFVSIPYASNGKIIGFAFRAIAPNAKPKYLDLFFSSTKTKKHCPFLLSAPLSDQNATLVEGEFDALMCRYHGIENAIGIGGSDSMDNALEAVYHKGYTSITILVDRDENEKQSDIQHKTERLIQAIKAAGMRPYVATFPDGAGKEDPDSFLKTHASDDLRRIISEAVPGSAYLYDGIRHLFDAKRNANGKLSAKELDEYKHLVIRLANNPRIIGPNNETERDDILADYAKTNGIVLESLIMEADTARSRQRGTAVQPVDRKTKSGSGDNGKNYEDLLLIPTRAERLEGFQKRSDDIATKYTLLHRIGGDECRIPLTIPTGALTLVAAPSGHGKSTFLRNLAIDVATNNPDKSVLYFSFEECEEHLLVQFINAFVGLKLYGDMNIPQQAAISNYYKNGAPDHLMVNGRAIRSKEVELFRVMEKEFMTNYLDTGRLRLYYRDYDLYTLKEAIDYAISNITNIAAIFVDYLQILRAGSGDTKPRSEQLKDMCIYLKDTSISSKLPIVLASQLNREARCAEEMHYTQMSESSDVEKSANTIILMWNSKYKPAVKQSEYDKLVKSESLESKEIEGLRYQTPGTLYAVVQKHRGAGGVGAYALLDFLECAGRINPEGQVEGISKQHI